MNKNRTDQLIDELYELAQTPLPASALLQARKCLFDYIGVTLAGAKMLNEKVDRFLDAFETVPGNSTLIGFERKTSLHTAALINGLCGHAAELDDGERVGMMHPGVAVMPALLALVEQEKTADEKLLTGIVIGYEAALRVARSIQPSAKDRGSHATGICGTIGAAMGIAATLDFSKEQMKDALSSAATGASGILEVIHGESELKPYNAGQAAASGLTAAFMARAGFKGPSDVLGGKRGFLSVMADQVDTTRLEGNKDSLAIERVYMKPYAACRHCHPTIDAILEIRSGQALNPEDVQEIRISTYWWAVEGHDHTHIEGVSAAKMSIPYSAAVALISGKAGLAEFELEQVENPSVISLTKRVSVEAQEALTALFPQKRVAVVNVITYGGQNYSAQVDLPKGEPETPLSEKELSDKFLSLAHYSGVTSSYADQIAQCVFETAFDARKLIALLQIPNTGE